jgi:hypothetical protein
VDNDLVLNGSESKKTFKLILDPDFIFIRKLRMKLIRKIGPRFELPVPSEFEGRKMVLTCHFCGEPGHKLSHCPNLPEDMRDQQQFNGDNDFLHNTLSYLF